MLWIIAPSSSKIDFNKDFVLHDFVSFFVCNIEKRIVWCISVKKNYYNLTKNNHKFHVSVSERCTSLIKSSGIFRQNPLKVPMKKLNL